MYDYKEPGTSTSRRSGVECRITKSLARALVKVLVKILVEMCVLVKVGGAIRESTGSMSRDLTSSIKGPR